MASPDGSVTDPRENAVGWNEIQCPWKERHGAIADVVQCKNDTLLANGLHRKDYFELYTP